MKKQILSLAMILVVLFACSDGKKELKREIDAFKKELPQAVEGSDIKIVDIALIDDIVAYTYSCPKEVWDGMGLTSVVANSDRNLARLVSAIPEEQISLFTKSNVGLRFIYKIEETHADALEIDMSPDKLKEVVAKVKNGEIKPYSLIEITEMQLARTEFPIKVDEGMWMTEAYAKDNKIYYVITLEYEIDPSAITPELLEEMKEEIIKGIREDRTMAISKNGMLKENVHIVYLYKDTNGQDLLNIDISPRELFGSDL